MVAFPCSLKACGNVGAIEKGTEINTKVAKKKRDPSVDSTLVITKCGLLAKAVESFENFSEMQSGGLHLWQGMPI